MSLYRIAMLPGDGVGNEITTEATKILEAVAMKHDFVAEIEKFEWGCDYYLKNGIMMPDDALEILKDLMQFFWDVLETQARYPIIFRKSCCSRFAKGLISTLIYVPLNRTRE